MVLNSDKIYYEKKDYVIL